jgi:hypothetical protein
LPHLEATPLANGKRSSGKVKSGSGTGQTMNFVEVI